MAEKQKLLHRLASTEGTAVVGDNFFHCYNTYRTLPLPGTAMGLCCSGSKILKIQPNGLKIKYVYI
jgi:hypothetical protein